MDTSIVDRLEKLLCQIQLGAFDSDSTDFNAPSQDLFNRLCREVFDKNIHAELWDEPVLSQLDWLFTVKPPELTIFGKKLKELRQRTQQVHLVNDLFFEILSREASAEQIFKSLEGVMHFFTVIHFPQRNR